eukprot:CAMPEP_0182855474 /NCGR_PEP_ID=MMETSP0034_2-20130328/1864_1 /TAXON_ID=156128 /ORGANISM="Nephroselmis pyriformis, Strain CCMP717" /LENGTH=1542 /DNA_ID=CAMNT_0024986443 /DNA_START=104 /DNA_END=4729 /DNA_ORIENTATION=+
MKPLGLLLGGGKKVAKAGRGAVCVAGEVLVLGPLGPLITRLARKAARTGISGARALGSRDMRKGGLAKMPVNVAKAGTGWLVGTAQSHAVLIALAVAWRINAWCRQRQRISMAGSVQLLRRLNPQAIGEVMNAAKNSKGMFNQGSNYGWLQQTNAESMEWINQILEDFWPFIDRMLGTVIADILEPLMNHDLPPGISSLQFDAFTLGSVPFVVESIKVLEEGEDEVKLHVNFKWEGDPNIIFAIRGMAIYGNLAPVKVQLVNLEVSGNLQIRLKPVLNELPLFGGVSIMLMEEPDVRYDVVLKATPGMPNMKLESVSGLNKLILNIVDDILRDIIVFPYHIFIPIAEGYTGEEDEKRGNIESMADAIATPRGIDANPAFGSAKDAAPVSEESRAMYKKAAFRGNTQSMKNLDIDIGELSPSTARNKAATQQKKQMTFGQQLMTKALKDFSAPDEVLAPEISNLPHPDDVDPADKKLLKAAKAAEKKRRELEEKKKARAEARKQAMAMISMMHKMVAIGHLEVQLVEGKGLPKADTFGLSDPYAFLGLVTGRKNSANLTRIGVKSKVVKNTLEPVWKETFTFEVHSLELQTLCVQIFDEDLGPVSDDLLGECIIPLKDAERGPLDKWVKLQNNGKLGLKGGPGGEVHLRIKWKPNQQHFNNEATRRFNAKDIKTSTRNLDPDTPGGSARDSTRDIFRAQLAGASRRNSGASRMNLNPPSRHGSLVSTAMAEFTEEGDDELMPLSTFQDGSLATKKKFSNILRRAGVMSKVVKSAGESADDGDDEVSVSVAKLSDGSNITNFTNKVLDYLVASPDFGSHEMSKRQLWNISNKAGGFPTWLTFPDVARVAWINLLISQLWPHIGELLLHEIRLVNPSGILNFHKFIEDWLKISEFTVGALTPVLTGFQVYKTPDPEVMMDINVKYGGDAVVGMEVTPFKWWLSRVGVEVGEIIYQGTVRVRLGPLLPVVPLFAAVSCHLASIPVLDASVKLKLSPLLPAIDIANIPGFVFAKSLIIKHVIRPEMEWPAGVKIPILDPESRLVQRHIELAGKVKGVLIVTIVEGRDLVRCDKFSTSDPYAVVANPAGHMTGKGKTRDRTSKWRYSKVFENNLNPAWNETFKFNAESAEMSPITIAIFDEDFNPNNKGSRAIRNAGGASVKVKEVIKEVADLIRTSRRVEELANINPDLLSEGIPWSPLVLEMVDTVLWIYRKLHGLPQKGEKKEKSREPSLEKRPRSVARTLEMGAVIEEGGERGAKALEPARVSESTESEDEEESDEEEEKTKGPISPRLKQRIRRTSQGLKVGGSKMVRAISRSKDDEPSMQDKLKELQTKVKQARKQMTLAEQMIMTELGRKGNDFMGMVIVEPGEMSAGEYTEEWYKLQGVPNGDVKVRIEWRPYVSTSNRDDFGKNEDDDDDESKPGTLFVEVVKCDKLVKRGGFARGKGLRPFVEVRAGGEVMRTPMSRGAFPLYSYHAEFIDLDPDEGNRQLSLRVWHDSKVGGKSLIGTVNIPLKDIIKVGRTAKSYMIEDINGRNSGSIELRCRWRE